MSAQEKAIADYMKWLRESHERIRPFVDPLVQDILQKVEDAAWRELTASRLASGIPEGGTK